MRASQIENWVLDVIDRVEAGQPNEDARVELKAKWIDPQKAARRLAGHANSARGDPILWLIGVDQKKGVVGAEHEELANWYPSIKSQFDGMAPTMVDINVEYKGKTVVALYFETDRAPFVTRNPSYGVEGGGPIEFEVPWREGTSIRTADRSDLIRLLVPILGLPQVETLGGELTIRKHDKYRWYLDLQLYITPQEPTVVVIPFHRCKATVKLPTLMAPIDLEKIRLTTPTKAIPGPIGSGSEPDSYTIAYTHSELILHGPGRVNFAGSAWSDMLPSELKDSTVDMHVKFSPTLTDQIVVIAASMVSDPSDQKNEIARWTL